MIYRQGFRPVGTQRPVQLQPQLQRSYMTALTGLVALTRILFNLRLSYLERSPNHWRPVV
jgi:hypothetical protein